MTHATPACCQVLALTPSRGSGTLPDSVACPDGPTGPSRTPCLTAACRQRDVPRACLAPPGAQLSPLCKCKM